MRAILVVVAMTLPGVLAAAEPVAWRVVNVHDGDTLTALDPANVEHRVRLLEVEAFGLAGQTSMVDTLRASV